jgi:hypothetical protein
VRIQRRLDAGYGHGHARQVGPDQDGFFPFFAREILPRFA